MSSSIDLSISGRIISIGRAQRSISFFTGIQFVRSFRIVWSRFLGGSTMRSRFLIRSSFGLDLLGRSSDFLLRASGQTAREPGR
jgi:hypothetical protein